MHFASFSHLDPAHQPQLAARQADESILVQMLAAHLKPEAKPAPLFAEQNGACLPHPGLIGTLLTAWPAGSTAGNALRRLLQALLDIEDASVKKQLLSEILTECDWTAPILPDAHSKLAVRTMQLAAKLSHWPMSKTLLALAAEKRLRQFSRHFLYAEHIIDALDQCDPELRYCFENMAGRAASLNEAETYRTRLEATLHHLGLTATNAGPWQGAGLIVQLSALHPHCERLYAARLKTELYPALLTLALSAKNYDLGLMIAGEEDARGALALQMVEQLAQEPSLSGWEGLGLTVQANRKQAFALIRHLAALAQQTHRKLMVRLCKGAYGHIDRARAQQDNLSICPVFSHCAQVDLSFLACAQALQESGNWLYPQIASHRPEMLARIHAILNKQDAEFQYYHGMGENLPALLREAGIERPWRVHAPLGAYGALLIERWLEICDSHHPRFSAAPCSKADSVGSGVDWADETAVVALEAAINEAQRHLAANQSGHGENARAIINPADPADILGFVPDSLPAETETALAQACTSIWPQTSPAWRAETLAAAADLIETRQGEFLLLLIREAGQTVPEALRNWRLLVTRCRHHADAAPRIKEPQAPGLALLIGTWPCPPVHLIEQICQALLAGYCVIVRPAQETPLIAARTIRCLHEAGVPTDALRILNGGESLNASLISDPRCRKILFAGGPSQTASLHCMVLDRSASLKLAVRDIVHTAFSCVGQRPSSLLCVPDECADEVIDCIKAAMENLHPGDPLRLDTDLGPLISQHALIRLQRVHETLREAGSTVWQAASYLPAHGFFALPTLVEIEHPAQMPRQLYAPLLCVLRYRSRKLDALLSSIADLAPDLEMDIYSRSTVFEQLLRRAFPACHKRHH